MLSWKKTGLFIKETTMQYRCNIVETLIISIQTLNIIYVYNVLISETIDVSLMFHSWFVDDSLEKYRGSIEETLMISMETL